MVLEIIAVDQVSHARNLYMHATLPPQTATAVSKRMMEGRRRHLLSHLINNVGRYEIKGYSYIRYYSNSVLFFCFVHEISER